MKRATKLACLAAFALLLIVAALVTLRSEWFRNVVRGKIVAAVERATGGRVEIGAFAYDWRTLKATVSPFVLHGTEAPGQPPLLRADRIDVTFRVISFVERSVDLTALAVEKPELSVVVSPDGKTNLPSPRLSLKELTRNLLDLKIRQFSVKNGWAQYNGRRVPLDIQAQDLNAHFRYAAGTAGYAGEVHAGSVRLNALGVDHASFNMDARLSLTKSGLQVADARLALGHSSVEASGTVSDFSAPRGALNLKAVLRPQDLEKPFGALIEPRGEISFTGKADFQTVPMFDWRIEGKASGRGLGYHNRYVDLNNAAIVSSLKLQPDRLLLPSFTLSALDGSLHGHLELEGWKKLSVGGDVRGMPIKDLARVSGPIRLEASLAKGELRDAVLGGKLTVEPAPGALPVQGFVDATYEQSPRRLSLGASALDFGTSRLEISGTVGQDLLVHAASRNLNDFLRLLPLTGLPVPKEIPVILKQGTARFDGTISGPIDTPKVSGSVDLTQFSVDGNDLDRLTSSFVLTAGGVSARTLALSQGPFHLEGSGRLGLTNWRPTDASPLSASISLRGAEIKRVMDEFKWKAPITGTLAATAEVTGTFGVPQVTAGIDAENVTAYAEHARRIRASIIVSGKSLQVIDGRIQSDAGPVEVRGAYTPAADGWRSGQFKFDLTGHGLALANIEHVQQIRKGIAGQVEMSARGTASLSKGVFRVDEIGSRTELRDASLEGRRYGNLTLTANSRGTTLDVQANANILGTAVHGGGEWKLEGDDPGRGQIVVPRVSAATLNELIPGPPRKPLPFEGFAEGKIDISGPLRKLDRMSAEIQISALRINAKAAVQPRAGAQARDLVLQNTQPIVLTATTQGIEIRNARLTGADTTLNAQGRFSFDSKNPWDLRLNGAINLKILQIFNPELLGSGTSILNAQIRGSVAEPQVEGRLELRNASLYVTDLPNGLDKANGVILFDRSRATVDSLSALTGGGTVTIQKGSFVGFRGPAVLYRVQASADHVRYRSPEGVSITVNALLSLIGSSDNSVLSGTVTMIRAGFNPTTDVGGLLATTTKPISTPSTASEYLRGMQFDVHVESAQALEIQTSLTRNINAQANLRVRGTPERPVVLGNVAVNEGEIEFFGNRYHINRGDVNFVNPVRIEPVLDMDLETVVRGITVDISFSGPLSKLNFSYRSDPPLQTNDIIALLAVGRTPAAAGAAIGGTQASTATNYLSTGNNDLLSQAITAPVGGRLQRFFGVSHIKIDPQLTDVTSVPQARLTLDQQISKDITLTYITNLTRTQEQIVRVEWDLNRRWSMIALRDENGAFGVDFQYRKRFK